MATDQVIPVFISRARGKRALQSVGSYRTVEDYVMNNFALTSDTSFEWTDADRWQRSGLIYGAIKDAAALTDDQADALWIAASTLPDTASALTSAIPPPSNAARVKRALQADAVYQTVADYIMNTYALTSDVSFEWTDGTNWPVKGLIWGAVKGAMPSKTDAQITAYWATAAGLTD